MKKEVKSKITGAKLIIISNRKFNDFTSYKIYRIIKCHWKKRNKKIDLIAQTNELTLIKD